MNILSSEINIFITSGGALTKMSYEYYVNVKAKVTQA